MTLECWLLVSAVAPLMSTYSEYMLSKIIGNVYVLLLFAQVRGRLSGAPYGILVLELMLGEHIASSASPHMWLADGDSLMCYTVRMSKLIA